MVNSLHKMENVQSKSIARIETQLKQVVDILKEGESQSQLMTNLIGVKYCILDPPLLMFVRLLVLLIFNYFV
jgi:cytochrome c-type biogenesis protein CcmH/NrfF